MRDTWLKKPFIFNFNAGIRSFFRLLTIYLHLHLTEVYTLIMVSLVVSFLCLHSPLSHVC